MKRIMCFVLLPFLLTACAPSYRIENQAHAVCMGIDFENGEMTLTVQVPGLGGKSGKSDDQSGSSYQIYSAKAENFEKAYNILEASLPQELNLTHVKTAVFSEAFARSDMFLKTMETFMNVFLVSGSAIIVVTEKTAKAHIENQLPYIGIRLSITIPSTLKYHADHGYIPLTTLSSLYAGLKGRFSTSIAALSDISDENDKKDNDAYMPGEMDREGKNKNEYMGAAVFDRDRMVGKLTGREMQLLYFIQDQNTRIADFTEPVPMRLSSRKKSYVKVSAEEDTVNIKVTLYLDCATLTGNEDTGCIKKDIESEIENLIQKCREMKVEPFGFALSASKMFSDNEAFERYDWLSRFSKSTAEVTLELQAEK